MARVSGAPKKWVEICKKIPPAFLQSEDSPSAFSRVDDAALDRQRTAEDTPLAFSKVEA